MLKKYRGLIIILALLLSMSMLLLGCGENAADSTAATNTGEDSSISNGDKSLQRVKDAGEISFAMSGGYPPFNFYNEENKLCGFDVDVCNEVAKRLKVNFKPVTTDWSGIIEGLRAGVYDGILGSMAITKERSEVVDFSTPYYYSGAQLLVRKDSSYQKSEDLSGKKVGLATGTTFEGDANKIGADVKLYKNDNQTLLELNNGNIDAVITDRVVGVNAINQGDLDFKLLGNPLRSEDIAVAFRQEDDSLREAIDVILQEMHEDGTLAELSEKWLKVDITVK